MHTGNDPVPQLAGRERNNAGDEPATHRPADVRSLFASVTCPTEKQYHLLRRLGDGSAWLSAKKREVEPLLRREWVTADYHEPYYQWVRITAKGLAALALGADKYGIPEMQTGHVEEKLCSDCQKPWNPRCRCGGRSYHYHQREVQRAA